jgi:ELWxxDGT repeat protein
MKRLLPALAFLFFFGASAQTVNLLKDINTVVNAAGSSPSNFTNVGGVVFFTANDPERGTELWKTDGTTGGTVVVKDINQGSTSSSPSYLTAIGSTVYFAANDGVNGTELWKSDGTDVGTVIVKDIYSGSSSSTPQYIIAVGSNLYFAADNGVQGRELWKSDGTLGNTVQLTEIYSGATGSNPAYLTNANGTVYFRATHPSYGTELWKSTGGAPTLVEDIYAGTSSSSPYNLIALNAASSSTIFFSAYHPTHEQELWKSEGTAATTNVQSIYHTSTLGLCGGSLCVIYDYTGSASPEYLVSTGSYVYFAATSPTSGREVWKHDGTTVTLVQDFVAGTGSLSPLHLTNVNGTIFFSGSNSSDRELYKATTSTVTLVTNINGSGSSSPTDFEATGSTVFFSATGSNGNELWKATTSTGATEVANINPGTASSSPGSKAYIGGKLYLAANNGTSGTELWKSDGTLAGTVIVKDINGGSEDGNPGSVFNTGTTLYFAATTSTTGSELWKSDGTSVNTVAVVDLNLGTSSSSPVPFAFNNSLLHFRATTATKGNEFHVSTGAVGNVTLREINITDETGSTPGYYGYATLGTSVYFSAYTPATGYELFRSVNGATASLVNLGTLNSATGLYAGTGGSYPQYLTVVGSYVYFSAQDDANGYELFRVSGSTIEATENLNISGSSYPQDLCAVGSTLYFQADNGSDGYELFKTTGTTISMVKTGGINSGSANANPQFMTNVNGTLFFRAIDGTNGAELWKSDGTSAGTVMVKNIHTTSNTGSDPSNLTAVGSVLYFTANEPTYGTELYKSDGTTGGTVLVKDIFTGTGSSSPSRLKNINGTLYFRASDGTGLNLMKTNGTTAGTIVATSDGGVVTYQGVDEIQYLNQNVYWVGTTNTYGKELLYVKAEPLNQPTSLVINGATATTLNLSWTAAAGAPAGYIVARHSGGAPTGLPVDGIAPALNSPLISGTGTVAYVGTGTSFTDTGLTGATTYYYAIYSYNNGGSSVNIYKPHSPLTGNNYTLAAEPTSQASGVSTSNVLQNSITVNWSSGDGSERIVLARSLSAVGEVPTDGTAYTANASFGSGTLIGSSYVVYRGAASSVNVTNLEPGVLYHFAIFELNGSGAQTNYLVSTPGAPGSATTLSLNGNQPTNLSFSSIGTNTITLTWEGATAGGTSGYIVTRRAGSDPVEAPVNMAPYSVNDVISGTSTVVYNSDNALVTSFTDPINPVTMSPGTVYYYRVYAKTAATTYVTVDPLTGNQTTLQTEPTGAPGAITFTPTTTSLSGEFTTGTGATSYIVLQRQAGVVSPSAPVDGTTYAVGNMIDDSEVVFVGDESELPFVSSGLASNTLYHYAAFSAAGSGAAINYLTSSSSVASRATLVDEPLEQPSNFVFENLASTSFDVSFSDAATIPDGYLVLRSTGSAVADAPDDGVAYLNGVGIGSAEVVHVGSLTAFSQSGLTPATTYHYAAFAYMGSGESINYLVAGPATGSRVTPASEPSAQPTGISFSARTTTSLSFSFSAAAGTPAGYLVLRSSGAAPTGVPDDGIEYTAGGSIGADVIVQLGSSTSVIDDNFGDELVEDTRYYYAIFSYNGSAGTYNYLPTTPLLGDAFTLADEPVDHPINMAFSDPTSTSMTVAFDEPAALPAGYLVLRRAGSAATGVPVDGVAYVVGNDIGDGKIVHVGSTPSFSSTGLTSSTIYHYTVFPFKGSGVSSNFLTVPTGEPVPVLTGSRTSLQSEPAGQPTSLSFSNISTSSAQVNFTASDATRYIVIRREGSAPVEIPDDGAAYADNVVIGSSVVTYTTNVAGITSVTDGIGTTAPMTPGVTYYYAIYGYNASSAVALNANYLTPAPLTGSVDILALAPSAQPTVLTFPTVTSSSVSGSFTAATGSPTGYIVVRRQGTAPTGSPAPGTTYTAGDPLGDGTIVYVGTESTFNDTGLSSETAYHYKVFSYSGTGGSINYLTASPLSNSITTLDTQPSQPTAFSVSSKTETSIQISFTVSGADHYLILRQAGSAPAESPVDRNDYFAGDPLGSSHVVHAGPATLPISDTGLSAGTVYHYAVFAYNGASELTYNYNPTSPLTANVSTLSIEPASSPTSLSFSGTTASAMTASFSAASGSPEGYLVLRREATAPTADPVDGIAYADGADIGGGTVVQTGSLLSADNTSLSSETLYHYRVYSYNGSGGSINYRTSSFLSGSKKTLDTEPTQPTNFSSSSITMNSFSIGMTLSSAEHYLILRKAGSAPTEIPVDGTEYITGEPLLSSTIVLAGDITLPISEAGLAAATVYHYAIYGYNGAEAATYNYNTVSPLLGAVGTLDADPTAQPTALVFSNRASSSATVSFTAAAGAPDGYLVIRREEQVPSLTPVDGTVYSAGADLGDGSVVVSVGAALSIDDSSLTPETEYFYQVYAFNGSGLTANFLTSSPLSSSFTTFATEPSQPTTFTSTNVETTSASIGFTSSGAQQYLILRQAGSAPAEVPVDGVGYTEGLTLGDADIVRAGAVPSLPFIDSDLSPGTIYHYTIYAYNGTTAATYNYNAAAPLTGTVGTLATEPASSATSMVFSSVTTSGMTVSFTAAVGSPDGYLVIRTPDSAPPTFPTDGTSYVEGAGLSGTIVHIGTEVTFSDSGLGSESVYYYSVFPFNGSGITTNYLTTSALTSSQITLATEPSPPTTFSSSNIGTTTLSFNFTESVDAQHYLILRKAGSAPGETPVDGTAYTTGLQLGSSDIVLAGDITTLPIDETGLTPGTVYHYKIFAYSGGTPAAYNYNTATPLTGTAITRAMEPTGQPGGLAFNSITTDGAEVSYSQASGTPAGYLVIRRQDAAPTGAPADGTPYAVDAPLGGGFVAYVGPDLSFTESGLTSEKTYHYLAFAYNGGAETINYFITGPAVGSFATLATEPATQPSGIEFANITPSGFTVSFTAATTAVAGYIAVRKAGGEPTGLPADGTTYINGEALGDGTVAFVGNATTFNETLEPAVYHYAIYAFNGSGESINYRTANAPKAALTIDNTGPVIVNNTEATLFFGADLIVSYTITDAESLISTVNPPKLFYRPLTVESTTAFTQKDMALSNGKYQATLTPSEVGGLGLDYYVEAVNGVGALTTSPTARLRVSFSGTQSMPELTGGDKVANFVIVAIPLELSNNSGSAVFSNLGSRANGTEWRMFRWNGTETEEFFTLGEIDVEPGKGYWLITKSNLVIAPGAGTAVPSTEQAPFQMVLTSGWNQIGNPYLFNLWWDDIREENPLAGSLPLRLFTGGTQPFTDGDILPVFRGGFTQVGAGTTLMIPTKRNSLAGGSRETDRRPKTNGLDSDDWEVIINLRHGDIANPFGGVGMSRDAKESYDPFDDFSMPRFLDFVELNHPKKAYGMVYTKDIIPLEESHVWEFSIDASTEGPTTLTWDNSYFGSNDRHIVLWDEEEQLATDMRKENSYSFVLGASRKFKVFFGNREFVEEQAAANTVLIHNISPNPTSAEATIEFSIPGQARSHVNVRVVNGMGQPVATVFDGDVEAGYHSVQWSGTDMLGLRPAAGVYLVEVINGEQRTSKRLVLK